MYGQIAETLKVTFTELVSKGVIEGVEPVFDESIDLVINEPRTKSLILAYLYYNARPGFEYTQTQVYPHRIGIHCSPGGPFDDISPAAPILSQRTFTDEWKDHADLLSQRMFLKFVDFGRDIGERSQRIRVGQAIERIKNRDPDLRNTLIVLMRSKIEEFVGEFVSLLFFRHLGYLTASASIPSLGDEWRQVSRDYTPSSGALRGVPDITCWNTPLVRRMRDFRLLEGGATLYEISMLRSLGRIRRKTGESLDADESIVVEVESDNPTSGIEQLLGFSMHPDVPPSDSAKKGYAESGIFDGAFLAAPFYYDNTGYYGNRMGMLSFRESDMVFQPCPKKWSGVEKEGAIKEIDEFLRYVLLSNLTVDELEELVGTKSVTFFRMVKDAENVSVDKLLEKLASLV